VKEYEKDVMLWQQKYHFNNNDNFAINKIIKVSVKKEQNHKKLLLYTKSPTNKEQESEG
jgi:hypothetical protein